MAASEPVEQNEPSGHGEHMLAFTRPSVLLYEPVRHGSAADAPSSQYEPAGHVAHAVSPPSSWYLPAAHLSQLPCSVRFCTVPGLHSVWPVAPVEQNEPSGHGVHMLAF